MGEPIEMIVHFLDAESKWLIIGQNHRSKHEETFPQAGIGTLVTHLGEFENPDNAHVMPICQSSIFTFPDVATGQAIFAGEKDGYYYTRIGNPNARHLARKIAALEGLDLLRG